MASSEDFKKILELYNQEVKSSGVSIVNFLPTEWNCLS